MSLIVGVDDYSSESDIIIIPSALDFVSQDEMLTPLGRLDKYVASENIFNRQMVARSLLDTLKAVNEDERDCITVLERVGRLADDSEPTVRAELMEQVPHIAIFCQENRPSIPFAFSKYLLPIVVRYLADQNNQVRKTSQAALLVLLEQELIERGDIETLVCPVLVDLTAPDSNDDVKTEAMAIICKMAPMVGKDITERLFLPRFCEMCCDCRMFHVRKVCAANFGDICSVVGGDATEELLLPRFFQLCSDNVWGVRKACAECFMTVSSSTSQEVRRTKLSSLFISLISDPSRWVSTQQKGGFLPFGNPQPEGYPTKQSRSTLGFQKPGGSSDYLTIVSPVFSPLWKIDRASLKKKNNLSTADMPLRSCHDVLFSASLFEHTAWLLLYKSVCEMSVRNCHAHLFLDLLSLTDSIPEQELYNSFHFWRMPIAEMDLDMELLQHGESSQQEPRSYGSSSQGKTKASAPVLDRKQLEELIENLEPHIDDPDVKAQVEVLTAALRATTMDSHLEDAFLEPRDLKGGHHHDNPFGVHQMPLIGDHSDMESRTSTLQMSHGDDSELSDSSFSPEDEKKSRHQDVIPQALLDQYLSMTDPSRAQTVDMEIAKHCAYSLPGVAMTLGRQNWHCLRDTYETLASDMQWKVRRTLAFSIHELALILGDQLTAADLVPIFNSFLKDLDEVRVGVLKHLYDFLKLLHQETRRKYLYQLQEFLVTDNSRNWRFRSELAEQLVLLLELYSGQDVYDYLRPLSFSLCTDRVSSVRWTSYKLVSEIIRKVASCQVLLADFLSELVEKFCHSHKWSGRQAFTFVCQLVIEDDCVSLEQFSEHLLAPLLQLASDPVANVRVLLAKTIRQSLMEREYFLHSANSHQEALEQTLVALQMDLDKDVKYFASVHPGSTRISEDAMSTTSSTY
uniref:Serine/threonine-protein phosphatase 4 regulatory subunit 1 n=1 Tax=Salmo trutta TaxID=8032 RepID=A0A674D564_SALTR